MTDATIRINVDASRARDGARVIKRDLNEIDKSADRARGGVDQLRAAFAALGGVLALRELSQLADQFTEVQNLARIAAGDIGNVNSTLDELFKIAQRTRQPIAQVTELFQRGSIAAKELGASQEELFQFTELVGQGLAAQGGSASAAAGALTQLSQALGSGTIRAEEFNSILEGAFPIAQAAARGLDAAGGSVARLRQMVIDGEVSSEQFFRALLSQSDELAETFESTTATVGQGFTQLRNGLVAFIGLSDQAIGASSGFARFLGDLGTVLTSAAFDAGESAKELGTANDAVVDWSDTFLRVLGFTVDGARSAFATMGAILSGGGLTIAAAFGQAVALIQGDIGRAREIGNLWLKDIGALADELASFDADKFRDAVAGVIGPQDEAAESARRLQSEAANAAEAMNKAAERGSEKVAEQINQQRELLGLLEAGLSIAEAETTARLRAQGASEAQIEETLRNAAAIDAIIEAREKAAESTDKMSRSEERLHGQIAQTRREIELMTLGFTAEQAERHAELEFASDLEREYLLLQQRLGGLRDEQEATNQTMREFQQELDSLSFGNAFAQGFDDASRAAGDLLDGINGLIEAQATFNKERQKAGDDAAKLAAIHQAEQKAQVGLFGDMTQAAKGFFDEGSKGYEALTAAEQAFRAIEIALAVENLARKIGLIATEEAAVVSAAGVKATAEGAASVASAGVGTPFPANLGAMAATIAALAAVGVAIGGSGGGGGGVSAPANSGSVFGDPLALSESIANSVSISAEADEAILGVNRQMLQSLRSLEAGLAAAANLFARTELGLGPGPSGPSRLQNQLTGVALTGPLGVGAFAADRLSGIAANAVSTILPGALGDILGGLIDGIGGVLGGILGGIGGFFAGRPKIKDEGVQILGGVFTDLLDDITVEAFRDIKIRRRFRHDKRKRQVEEITGEIDSQFQLIVDAIGDSVISAAQALRIDDSAIDAALAGLEIDTIRISTRKLDGEEVAEQVDAAFSNLFDQVANAVVPFIDEFARIGEGAGETLTRIASNVGVAEAGLARVGASIDATSYEPQFNLIEDGVDGVRRIFAGFSRPVFDPEKLARISTSLIDAAGGLQEFGDLTAQFVADFRTESEQIAILSGEIAGVFADLGVAMPRTRDGFVDLIEGFEVTDEASARLFAQLLDLGPALDQVFDAAEATTADALEVQRAFGLATSEFDDTLRELGIRTLPETESGMRALIDSLSEAEQAGLRPFIGELRDLVVVADDAAQSVTTVLDTFVDAAQMSANSLTSIFEGVLVDAQSASEARMRAAERAEQAIFQHITGALLQSVSQMIVQGAVNPLLQSAAQSAAQQVAGSSASASALAAGGAAGGQAVASGGAAGGSAVAQGGTIAGQGLAAIVDRAVNVVNTMTDILNSEEFQEALSGVTSAIGDIAAGAFDAGTFRAPQFEAPQFDAPSFTPRENVSGAREREQRIEDERARLQVELLRAMGDEEEALRRERERQLETMPQQLRALQQEVWAAEDAAEEAARRQRELEQEQRASARAAEEAARAQEEAARAAEAQRNASLDVLRAFDLAPSAFQEVVRSMGLVVDELPRTADAMGDFLLSLSEAQRAALQPFIGELQGLIAEQAAVDSGRTTGSGPQLGGTVPVGFAPVRTNQQPLRDALRQAFDRESQALQQTVQQFDTLRESLNAFAAELSPASSQFDALSGSFAELARQARLGDLDALEQLPSVGRDFVTQIEQTATSRLDLDRQVAAVRREILAAEEVAGRQGNIAQQQLEELRDQVSALISIEEAVVSVEDAIRSLTGRGFASGGIASGPSSGFLTALHDTEAVVPLPDGRSIPVVTNSDATDRRLERIERQVAALTQATENGLRNIALHTARTEKNTRNTSDTLEDWDVNGQPVERAA